MVGREGQTLVGREGTTAAVLLQVTRPSTLLGFCVGPAWAVLLCEYCGSRASDVHSTVPSPYSVQPFSKLPLSSSHLLPLPFPRILGLFLRSLNIQDHNSRSQIKSSRVGARVGEAAQDHEPPRPGLLSETPHSQWQIRLHSFFLLFIFYLFIWLHRVLIAACRII